MENVPIEDIYDIWNDLPEKNWASFRDTVESRKNQAEGTENTLVDQLVSFADMKENTNEPFPNSPDEMYSLINQENE